MTETPLQKTPLHALHVALGARMVPFAGYDMPVQYPSGILAEHLWTRQSAGLFDVSHMGQIRIGKGRVAEAAIALERLVPIDIAGMTERRQRYGFFTTDTGGIIDDLMLAQFGDHLFMVVNAANKHLDLDHLKANLPAAITIEPMFERALLALQGPMAVTVLAEIAPEVEKLGFMQAAPMKLDGIRAFVSRSGYTGEDGFEISGPAEAAAEFAQRLLSYPAVKPIGLGARDSLRLEAGLCLHGQDIDTTTTPVEAGIDWAIGKRRREQGGFPGDAILQRQLRDGPQRRRVGIQPVGKAPARAHTVIANSTGKAVGEITSGGFGPSVNAPVAMGYVETASVGKGVALDLLVRDKKLPAHATALPFVPHRYRKS